MNLKTIVMITITWILCCLLIGCKSSYISNKKDPVTDEKVTNESTNNLETTENSISPPVGFSMSTALLVKHQSGSTGSYVEANSEPMIIENDTNKIWTQLYCSPDLSLKWDIIPARIYLIDNGRLLPFKIGNGEYDTVHDIEYVTYEQLKLDMCFEQRALSSSSGILTMIVIFHPDELPGIGVKGYSASNIFSFEYINEKYNNDSHDIQVTEGEYIDIPEEYIKSAMVAEIGPKEIYTDDYSVKSLHYFEDLEVENADELYVSINAGKDVSGDVFIGIICDGRLLQFNDGNYFIRFKACDGSRTFQYRLSELSDMESGLHYFQVINIPIENAVDYLQMADGVSERYRIKVTGVVE